MTLKKLTLVSFRIILVFAVGITMSFIGDYLHKFLGDWYCQGTIYGKLIKETQTSYEHYERLGCMYNIGNHNPTWHYGWRHWLFIAMGFCLFILQAIDVISFINKKDK